MGYLQFSSSITQKRIHLDDVWVYFHLQNQPNRCLGKCHPIYYTYFPYFLVHVHTHIYIYTYTFPYLMAILVWFPHIFPVSFLVTFPCFPSFNTWPVPSAGWVLLIADCVIYTGATAPGMSLWRRSIILMEISMIHYMERMFFEIMGI